MNRFTRIGISLLLLAMSTSPVLAQDATEEPAEGVIIVGTDATYPPFETLEEDGSFVGFDIDLFTAIAEDAGFEVQFVNAGFDTIFTALAAGEFDVVISASTITEEREEIIDFSDPYFIAGQIISISAEMEGEIEGVEDLAGRRIGVQLGTTGAEYAQEIEGAQVESFNDVNLAFQALGAGELDAVIADAPTSIDIIANNPDINAITVGDPLTDEFYGIAVDPNQPELLDQINLSLANIIESGEYAEIYMEWFGVEADEMFQPGGETAMEYDFTTPESAAVGFLGTLLSGEATLEEVQALVCEGAAPTPLNPADEMGLATFQGIVLEDASALELEVTVDGTVAEVVPSGNITLNMGGASSEQDAGALLQGLGITSLRFEQNEDGNWQYCPSAE